MILSDLDTVSTNSNPIPDGWPSGLRHRSWNSISPVPACP